MGAWDLSLCWMPGTEQPDPQTFIRRMRPRSRFPLAPGPLQLRVPSEITSSPDVPERVTADPWAAPAHVTPGLARGAVVSPAGWRAAGRCLRPADGSFRLHHRTQTRVCGVSLVAALSCRPAEGGLRGARANIPVPPAVRALLPTCSCGRVSG